MFFLLSFFPAVADKKGGGRADGGLHLSLYDTSRAENVFKPLAKCDLWGGSPGALSLINLSRSCTQTRRSTRPRRPVHYGDQQIYLICINANCTP